MKHFEKAPALFKWNVADYPESYNVYDSLADYNQGVVDKKNAIKNYQNHFL